MIWRKIRPCSFRWGALLLAVTVLTLQQQVARSDDNGGGGGSSTTADAEKDPQSLNPSSSPVAALVYFGPSSREETKCAPSDQVTNDHFVTLHYNATIDVSSETGQRGLLVDSTHKAHTDYPEPIMLHMGDTDPMLGWSKGLLGLCSGDFLYLVVPPELAYGEEGDGAKIPGGATLKLDIHIVTAHTSPEMHYRAKQDAEKMFKEMDSDGNGKVTIEEMEVFLDVPEDYPNRASYIRQHFELSDYNKDGFVTLEEFKTILANFQGIDELYASSGRKSDRKLWKKNERR